MAFTITKNKELEKHVDFDISFITSNLKDGEYFADDKKITPRTKNYIIKIPKTSISTIKNALRKLYKKSWPLDSISLGTDTGVELVLKKTGKTRKKAAIAKKGRFNILRIYRKNKKVKECNIITHDMRYMDKKYGLGKTENICGKRGRKTRKNKK